MHPRLLAHEMGRAADNHLIEVNAVVTGDTFDHGADRVKTLLRQREQPFRCGVQLILPMQLPATERSSRQANGCMYVPGPTRG